MRLLADARMGMDTLDNGPKNELKHKPAELENLLLGNWCADRCVAKHHDGIVMWFWCFYCVTKIK